MSNLDKDVVTHSQCLSHPEEAIDEVISAEQKDLGGFKVNRMLPNTQHKMIGPWVFFDHLPFHTFAPSHGIDVRPHPHIGIATVTYLFAGQLHHRDSLGSDCIIKSGDINLMTAGSGIAHSERTPQAMRKDAHDIHALQLWLALPDHLEECEPAFQHYSASDIPELTVGDAMVRLMMGEAYGATSPVKQYSPVLYLEVRIPQGGELTLPHADELGVFIVEGNVKITSCDFTKDTLIVMHKGATVTVKANQDCTLVVIGGKSVGQRHFWWNFVSSSKERIEQAKQDWLNNKFAPVVNDDEFIPLPD